MHHPFDGLCAIAKTGQFAFACALLLCFSACSLKQQAVEFIEREYNAARWEETISKFEKRDKEQPPAPNGILFIGSSSIVRWDTEKYFPGYGVINRGFGGSQIVDSIHYADRVVIPYQPQLIVFYAGNNDIKAGKPPEEVAADFVKFKDVVHKALPETKMLYISIHPSVSRWSLDAEMRKANTLIQKQCGKDKRLTFVSIYKEMLGKDGTPNKELLHDDMLHLSPKGYELWTKKITPYLDKAIKKSRQSR